MPPRTLALLLAAAACSSSGGEQAPAPPPKPEPVLAAPLSGELPPGAPHRTARATDFTAMLDELAKADVVYVGTIRGGLLDLRLAEHLLDRGRLHAVALASVPRDAQPALDAWVYGSGGEPPPAAAAFGAVLELARKRRLPLLALGLDAETREALVGGGAGALPEDVHRDLPALPEGADPDDEVAAELLLRWFRRAPADAQALVLAPRERLANRRLPRRVQERLGRTHAVVVPLEAAEAAAFSHDYADFVWLEQ
jgi:hypothetical protein